MKFSKKVPVRWTQKLLIENAIEGRRRFILERSENARCRDELDWNMIFVDEEI